MTTKSERRTIVSNKLNTSLSKLRETKRYLQGHDDNVGNEDVCTLYLGAKMNEISKLGQDIDQFENPDGHFTKQYRTLDGHCTKLIMDVDKVDVSGRDDLHKLQNDAIADVKKQLELLQQKIHSGGKTCDKCELQK